MTKHADNQSSFLHLGISPRILDVLTKKDFTQPTPIQLQSIPTAIEGKDIVGIAQTGTGKTLAFGIPLIQRIGQAGGRGLVLVPTRELAKQVEANLSIIGKDIGLRTAVLIGGESKNVQLQALKKKPHVIIATPGRLIDHIKTSVVRLDDIRVLVLDEADMMFDIGFAPQIKEILRSVPTERQTMLFSATMPPAILSLVAAHMKIPVTIEVAPAGTPAEKVNQEMVVIKKDDRQNRLEQILSEYKGSVLVFCRTKHGSKKLAYKVRQMRHTADEIHSNRSLAQRARALKDFKSGKVRVLVATDIAARGIDVKGIELVVNYDLPENAEDYVHRIGRTGRAGSTGQAISFVLPSEMKEVKKIEQIIKKTLPLTKLAQPDYTARSAPRRRSAGRNQTNPRNSSTYQPGRGGIGRRGKSPKRSTDYREKRNNAYAKHTDDARPKKRGKRPGGPRRRKRY